MLSGEQGSLINNRFCPTGFQVLGKGRANRLDVDEVEQPTVQVVFTESLATREGLSTG